MSLTEQLRAAVNAQLDPKGLILRLFAFVKKFHGLTRHRNLGLSRNNAHLQALNWTFWLTPVPVLRK